MEVEEGENEDGEEERAVDAGTVQDVGGGDEEDEVDGGGVGSGNRVSAWFVGGMVVVWMRLARGTYKKNNIGIQLRKQNMLNV